MDNFTTNLGLLYLRFKKIYIFGGNARKFIKYRAIFERIRTKGIRNKAQYVHLQQVP